MAKRERQTETHRERERRERDRKRDGERKTDERTVLNEKNIISRIRARHGNALWYSPHRVIHHNGPQCADPYHNWDHSSVGLAFGSKTPESKTVWEGKREREGERERKEKEIKRE